nr:minor capsid protein [uncultured Ottowia sp.]
MTQAALEDRAIHHAIALQRYANGVVARMLAVLNQADAELFAALLEALERLPESYTASRLEALLQEVRQVNQAAYDRLGRALKDELESFAATEAAFQHRLLLAAAPAHVSVAGVEAAQVFAAAWAQPFRVSHGGAVPMAQFLAGLSHERARMVRDAVSLGWLEGESVAAIVRRIRGTRAAGYADGLMQAPRRYVESMARTAINHLSAFTQQRTYAANADLVQGWRFVATLDSRTSITCASLSGRVFPIGKGPLPPRHLNCRSTTVPVLKPLDGLDYRPSQRASADGPVAADMTFSQWLRAQPASVQDDVLGATRGKLFRAGNLDVSAFTNNKGVVYTLDELRRRNAALFERAGL